MKRATEPQVDVIIRHLLNAAEIAHSRRMTIKLRNAICSAAGAAFEIKDRQRKRAKRKAK